jgi:hypothetical protein
MKQSLNKHKRSILAVTKTITANLHKPNASCRSEQVFVKKNNEYFTNFQLLSDMGEYDSLQQSWCNRFMATAIEGINKLSITVSSVNSSRSISVCSSGSGASGSCEGGLIGG